VTVTAGQLKVARQLLGWNQEQLAVEARVSPSTVSQFEAGRAVLLRNGRPNGERPSF
jgi:transcriptional regulator with XRE-family HTH domain